MNITQEDQRKTLELLCRRFTLTGTDECGLVKIFSSDLNKFGLSLLDFAEATTLLEKDIDIKIITPYDEDLFISYSIERSIKGELADEPSCFELKVPNNFRYICENKLGISLDLNGKQNDRVKFDGRCVEFKNVKHSFQNRSDSNCLTLKVFRELWNNKNKEIQKGQLAVKIDLIIGAASFWKNAEIIERLKNIIKGINRNMKDKNIPIKIQSHGKNVLMDIKDKKGVKRV